MGRATSPRCEQTATSSSSLTGPWRRDNLRNAFCKKIPYGINQSSLSDSISYLTYVSHIASSSLSQPYSWGSTRFDGQNILWICSNKADSFHRRRPHCSANQLEARQRLHCYPVSGPGSCATDPDCRLPRRR